MRRSFLRVLCVVSSLLMGCGLLAVDPRGAYMNACLNGADVRIELCVTNDKGEPVPGATVEVLMGMNFRVKSYMISGVTDKDGKFIIQGKTTGNEIEIEVDKEGWYGASRKLCFVRMGEEYEVKDGRWQPWNMHVPVIIREIRNQVPLVTRRGYHKMTWKDQWVGFDLEQNDWVEPYGAGKVVDFEARLTWDGLVMYYTKQTALDVRFPGESNGSYEFANFVGCSFGGAYEADDRLIGRTGINCSCGRDPESGCWKKGVGGENCVVVRTRTKVNENGEIVTASYATIKAMSIEGGADGAARMYIRYFFNPRPNDRNLEPERRKIPMYKVE